MNNNLLKGSPQYINKLNKIKILNVIREKGQISRADLVKYTGISAPTITRIVNNLIRDERLVKEVGIGKSSGGRKPTLIEFAGLENFVIGIDLGTTHIDGVLSNLNAETIAEIRVETRAEEGFNQIMNRTAEIISRLRKHPAVKKKKIFGVGIAVAGLVNRKENVVEFSPDFHWENVDIIKTLKSKCNLPIKFDNVTRVMALGELWYGVGRKVNNFIVINIGYGIGAGIIIDGKPLYGEYGMAGEFGHITMEKNSKYICECGNYGCLEALSSGRAIALSVKNGLQSGRQSILNESRNGGITAAMVAEAAMKGDKLCKEVFDEAAEYLGIGITNLINLTSPEVVLIGGGVAQAKDLILKKIIDTVNKRGLRTKSRKVHIQPVSFGINAASKGALALVLNEVLQLNQMVY